MKPLTDPLIRAWALLIALSALATAVAVLRPANPRWAVIAVGAMILALAWIKARVILNSYLELSAHPGPRRAFGAVLGTWALAALVLYVAAG